MPFSKNTQLPLTIRKHLPVGAQTIFREVFNQAWHRHENPKYRKPGTTQEETAHRIAWFAVKKSYQKGKSGKWIKK